MRLLKFALVNLSGAIAIMARMPLFEKRREIPRRELREILRKAPGRIPGAGGRMYGRRERVEMEKLFEKKYGTHISEREFIKRLRELRHERFKAPTGAEKQKIDRLIRYLKELGGIKKF